MATRTKRHVLGTLTKRLQLEYHLQLLTLMLNGCKTDTYTLGIAREVLLLGILLLIVRSHREIGCIYRDCIEVCKRA